MGDEKVDQPPGLFALCGCAQNALFSCAKQAPDYFWIIQGLFCGEHIGILKLRESIL
jgi:hypothetical protein